MDEGSTGAVDKKSFGGGQFPTVDDFGDDWDAIKLKLSRIHLTD